MAYQEINNCNELKTTTKITLPNKEISFWQRVRSIFTNGKKERSIPVHYKHNIDPHRSENLEIAQNKAMAYYRRY